MQKDDEWFASLLGWPREVFCLAGVWFIVGRGEWGSLPVSPFINPDVLQKSWPLVWCFASRSWQKWKKAPIRFLCFFIVT